VFDAVDGFSGAPQAAFGLFATEQIFQIIGIFNLKPLVALGVHEASDRDAASRCIALILYILYISLRFN
jgi:hypothetical protein